MRAKEDFLRKDGESNWKKAKGEDGTAQETFVFNRRQEP